MDTSLEFFVKSIQTGYFLAILFAFLLLPFLMKRYRRKVISNMATKSGEYSQQPPKNAQTHSVSLRRKEVSKQGVSQSALHTTVTQKGNALTRIYFIHGFLLALTISLFTLFAANHPDGVFAAQVILLMLIYAFPIVLIYRSIHGMNQNFFVLAGVLIVLSLIFSLIRNDNGLA